MNPRIVVSIPELDEGKFSPVHFPTYPVISEDPKPISRRVGHERRLYCGLCVVAGARWCPVRCGGAMSGSTGIHRCQVDPTPRKERMAGHSEGDAFAFFRRNRNVTWTREGWGRQLPQWMEKIYKNVGDRSLWAGTLRTFRVGRWDI